MNYKIKINTDPENVWFTSDWHLFHNNILKYDNRPFKCIEDMNGEIIQNHSQLTSKDHLFNLGDLCFGRLNEVSRMLHRIRAEKDRQIRKRDKLIKKYPLE